MKHLFIDSNIWLSLYHFTKDDLEQFRKLKELIDTGITLIIPQQVDDEVYRNREVKLCSAFKQFTMEPLQFPAFCKEYEEYASFFSDYKSLKQRFLEWRKRIDLDIQSRNLPADKVIDLFFTASNIYPCDSAIDRAYTRYCIGNPPGKENSYGDAINWECLLEVVPDGEALYFISADKDYRSTLFDNEFNPFLQREWSKRKSSNIIFYTNLVPFLQENFKDIQLKAESEKQTLIDKLKHSCSFISTHGIIAMLNKYDGWTADQIDELCSIATVNNQVRWILEDSDVFSFYQKILCSMNLDELDSDAVREIAERLRLSVMEKEFEAEKNARETWAAEVADALEEYGKH